jgi:hypothetical protein
MKIYRFRDMTSNRHSRYPASPADGLHGQQRTYYGGLAAGGDVIEISDEAKRRFQADKVVELEYLATRKTAREYARMIRDLHLLDEGDQRVRYRPWKAASVKNRMEQGRYPINQAQVIEIAAEKILHQIAA